MVLSPLLKVGQAFQILPVSKSQKCNTPLILKNVTCTLCPRAVSEAAALPNGGERLHMHILCSCSFVELFWVGKRWHHTTCWSTTHPNGTGGKGVPLSSSWSSAVPLGARLEGAAQVCSSAWIIQCCARGRSLLGTAVTRNPYRGIFFPYSFLGI